MRQFPNNSIEAVAGTYTSFLPLLHLNASRRVVLREYLCGRFMRALRDQQKFRLRWMQRYTTNPGVDIATWFLDEVRVRVWNGSCFESVLNESFSSNSSLEGRGGGVGYNIVGHSTRVVAANSCDGGDEAEGGTALYFNRIRDSTSSISRRSLVIKLENQTLGSSCEEQGTFNPLMEGQS